MIRSAVISACGTYRYQLFRQWRTNGIKKPVLWVMLNPSTADGSFDDPTILRCIAFADLWGFGSMFVANLYSYRTKSPELLLRQPEDLRCGPEHMRHMRDLLNRTEMVVCAWGNHGGAKVPDYLTTPLHEGGLWHLGLTQKDCPRHPLYAPGSTRIQPYSSVYNSQAVTA